MFMGTRIFIGNCGLSGERGAGGSAFLVRGSRDLHQIRSVVKDRDTLFRLERELDEIFIIGKVAIEIEVFRRRGGMALPRTGTDTRDDQYDELTKQFISWARGLEEEVDFWDDWVKTKGSIWPDEFQRRLRTENRWQADNLPYPSSTWRILDVGAGPISALCALTGDGEPIDIVAVDPLARAYAQIWKNTDVIPPIVTKQAFAEDLTAIFDPETFDLTNMQNALDHSFDPVRALEEMLIVTKVGGYVKLLHATDEAERENYIGLHQWNFNIEGDKFVIWNKSGKATVDPLFSDFSNIRSTISNGYITTIIHKTLPSPIDLAERRKRRMQTMQDTMMALSERLYSAERNHTDDVHVPEPKIKRRSMSGRLFAAWQALTA